MKMWGCARHPPPLEGVEGEGRERPTPDFWGSTRFCAAAQLAFPLKGELEDFTPHFH